MAINPSTLFQNLNGPDTEYPYGSAKNSSGVGLKDGTEIKAQVFNDIWGFLQRVLDEADVEPSGNPDTVLVSQYYDALMSIIEGVSRGAVASETERGAIELATQAEVNAGTDTDKAVTPATLSTALSSETSGDWQDATLLNGWIATAAKFRLILGGSCVQISINKLEATNATDAVVFGLPDGYAPPFLTTYFHFVPIGLSEPIPFYISNLGGNRRFRAGLYEAAHSYDINLIYPIN